MGKYKAFENIKERTEAYSIVSEIFNTFSEDLQIDANQKHNPKLFNLLELSSKRIAKSFVDKIIKSHQDWATEQDEYLQFYEQVKREIDNL